MAKSVSTFYRELMARLLEVHTDSENRQHLKLDIRHIDLYCGQDLGPDGGIRTDVIPFQRRAVLIEIAPIDWRSIGRHIQRSDNFTINLHILSECKLETSSPTPPNTRNLALEHLDFLDSITYRLTGWSASVTSSLSRTGMVPYESKGIVHKHILTFTCAIEDDAAARVPVSVESPSLNLTVSPVTEPAS